MQRIVKLKRSAWPTFCKNMLTRVEDAVESAKKTIGDIGIVDGILWTKDLLLKEAELKKRDHLCVKQCVC